MVATLMLRQGYKPGKGLGASLQGISKPISPFSDEGTFSLGFRTTQADKNKAKHRKKYGWDLQQPIPHIFYTFVKPRLQKGQNSLVQSNIDEICHGLSQMFSERIQLIDEYMPLSTYFPDEEVNSIEEVVPNDQPVWKMYFDGAVNIKGVGIGAILILPIGYHYPTMARLRFFCTNNMAEYESCIIGLKMAIDLDVHELLVMGDSDLLIRQAQGEWETRDIMLIPYRQCMQDLSKRFKSIEFRYIPRFHNELADALATLASMLPYPGNTHIDPLEIQVRNQHGYCNTIETEPNGEPWYHDIKRFLKIREYPEHAKGDQKRTIRRLVGGFFLNGEILYKRTPDLNLLRCIDSTEAERIMSEVHSGVCGPHMNGYILAKKILRAGYYWLTIERDCFSFVRKCHQCQIHGDLIHSPPSELHRISSP
uniref:Uncharacterized protein LOC104233114 n=1 Tax=Nicotiana sylvestris TaxID=4096 RepID=A0A1U7WXT4_NICSY|nr:PREDICTED: uncharacterized protein LOC104233114 [Nicotiana sylvestris]